MRYDDDYRDEWIQGRAEPSERQIMDWSEHNAHADQLADGDRYRYRDDDHDRSGPDGGDPDYPASDPGPLPEDERGEGPEWRVCGVYTNVASLPTIMCSFYGCMQPAEVWSGYLLNAGSAYQGWFYCAGHYRTLPGDARP